MSEHLVRQPRALPDTEIDAAREGTCAAWVAECIINGDATCADDLVGKTHENGWFVDQTMADNVQPYVKMLQARSAGVQAEVRISFDNVQGTLDALSVDGTTLYIDDLKYGYGIVEPYLNKQLLCYMAGILDQYKGTVTNVQLGIYQPRAIHPDGIYRTWDLNFELAEGYVNWIRELAAAVSDASTAHPGPHCMHCLRAHDCVALTHSVYDMWEPVNANGLTDATGPELSDELKFLHRLRDILEARVTGLEADIEGRLSRNEFVPGWAMAEKTGKRMFTVDGDTIKAFTGIDPWDKKLITPAELERRHANKDVVKAMTKTPRIGRKLTRVSEKTIAKMFGG